MPKVKPLREYNIDKHFNAYISHISTKESSNRWPVKGQIITSDGLMISAAWTEDGHWISKQEPHKLDLNI